jgi:uncharacterized protein (DUF1015 family)
MWPTGTTARRRPAGSAPPTAAQGGAGWFLAGLFPDRELRVLAYNRLVQDLHGHSAASLKEAIEAHFVVSPSPTPTPERRGQWTMYLEGQWWRLEARPGVVPVDPVGSLDVSVLQDRILAPLLGISGPSPRQAHPVRGRDPGP